MSAVLQEANVAVAKYQHYVATHQRDFPADWYTWQDEYFKQGAKFRERLMLCGNRGGKTFSTCYEDSCHITGNYPDDWQGFKFEIPLLVWIFGVDASQTRDVLQKELFGRLTDEGKFTGGWIHPDEIVQVVRGATPGLARDVFVKWRGHKNRTTQVTLRSYTQIATGQDTLSAAGSNVDLVHADEQPPDTLMGQLRTRLMLGNAGKGGMLVCGCTPELGPTDFVMRFMEQPARHQKLIGPIAWAECPHITPEIQQDMRDSLPPHELEMREKGLPYLSGGRIFTVAENRVTCEPFPIPDHYRRLVGFDIGLSHPSAGLWTAYDPDTDIIYVTYCYRKSFAKGDENEMSAPAYHASRLRSQGKWIPVVFPHDAEQREKGSGKTIASYYNREDIYPLEFSNADGTNFVEPGLLELLHRMQEGRLKVFSTVDPAFWQEYRLYRRDEKTSKVVAMGEDIMSALRYSAIMVPRYGVAKATHKAANGITKLYPDIDLSE